MSDSKVSVTFDFYIDYDVPTIIETCSEKLYKIKSLRLRSNTIYVCGFKDSWFVNLVKDKHEIWAFSLFCNYSKCRMAMRGHQGTGILAATDNDIIPIEKLEGCIMDYLLSGNLDNSIALLMQQN